ncbi:lipase family protein [Actinoallomurus purpureus]|uniref:lipase family protein n=1 Tax=Actinoallomurus purpureus TaxID=478114 RepID=UPI002092E429|nr:lipase family protein [Actinoallomurus purpureus]MCO6008507.1 lipase family protein [Actinoallomurus purpureus]
MRNGHVTPLKSPPGYDLKIAQTCSFLVNVACDMCAKWIAAGKPPPDKFTWKPSDSCPITSPVFPLDKWKFVGPIWSTFTSKGKKVSEPFAIFAYGPDPTTAYLAFRGTQTGDDWDEDLKFDQVPYTPPTRTPITGIKVAHGFYDVFNGLDQNALNATFSKIASGRGRLTVTGHSLGSTLATLTVPLAYATGIPGANILLHAQASPKVGNSQFQAYYNDLGVPTFRLVNTSDVVPKMPPGPYVPVGLEAPYDAAYPTEAECHNPCCSYSYAVFHPDDPYNPDMDTCMARSEPEMRVEKL